MNYPVKPDYRAALTGLLAFTNADPEALCDALFSAFGCYSGIFDAPTAHLLKLPGMTEDAAALIKLLPAIWGRAERQSHPLPKNINDPQFGNALTARFFGCGSEQLAAVAADSGGRILGLLELTQTRYSGVEFYTAQIVDFAVCNNAAGIVLAHNHPDGFAIPSARDNAASVLLRRALEAVDVTLLDHIIVADGDYVSMRDSADYGECDG